ncbi:hypothetical protein AYO40_05135 [Planctomycetaceae bacterium SCGC AG-212-D15]|nr:hypothetical protein AYO40_05135 [Planctomycetaceae bacterium SCGC AG-212-D15]
MMRALPPGKLQDRSKSQCWAAALWSWLQVTPGRTKMSVEQLVKSYSNMDDGGVSEQQLKDVVFPEFGMSSFGDSGVEKTINSIWVDKKLALGHVLLIYKSGYISSHTHVVYGVKEPGDATAKFCVMDPWWGYYKEYARSEYDNKPVLFAWPV